MTNYKIPNEYYFRLHHVRPRFKNDIESVLLFMASEIAHIDRAPAENFNQELNAAIRLYPGNGIAKEKTIDNWRTEISSLFGLIEYDGNDRMPSKIAIDLADNEDLVEFFRKFLIRFQYPGGHLKPHEIAKMIEAGVRFKPTKYLLQVLLEGMKINDGHFGITKAEATHCIFNDLRITRDGQSPSITVRNIITNRKNTVEYDNSGDITRYAGDILDYMVLAGLLKRQVNSKYYLNTTNMDVISTFLTDNSWFDKYDEFYQASSHIVMSTLTNLRQDWFSYVNANLQNLKFETNILSIISDDDDDTSTSVLNNSDFIKEMLLKIRSRADQGAIIKTKDIGDTGEAITIFHEQNRLIKLNRQDLAKLVKKIPELYAVGYDISSYDGVQATRRYIEVKTTISYKKLHIYNFHMTPSEWSAAETNRKNYYVYRLAISKGEVSLFVINDPVGQYKRDLLEMIPRDGADIRYNEQSGQHEDLLV